jgi:uncharacterized protein YbjT (DUF2867 family)
VVAELLAASPGYGAIVAALRRPADLGIADARLRTPIVTFGRLSDDAEALAADQVFVCLGTTMKKAGSRAAFRAVDHDAVLEGVGVAVGRGARDVLLVSSVGADPAARGFYLRVKGETEAALAELPLRSLHVFRPSILKGARAEARPAERAGILVGSVLSPLMVGPLRRYRPVSAAVVARAMVRAARDPGEGRFVHESEEIAALGAERGGPR